MIPATPLRSAQADIRRAACFYENQAPGLGAEFVLEVEHAFMRVSETAAPLTIPHSGGAR